MRNLWDLILGKLRRSPLSEKSRRLFAVVGRSGVTRHTKLKIQGSIPY